jgi:hypothetical protein
MILSEPFLAYLDCSLNLGRIVEQGGKMAPFVKVYDRLSIAFYVVSLCAEDQRALAER